MKPRLIFTVAVVGLCIAACAGPQAVVTETAYPPGPFLPYDRIEDRFQWRQTVRATWMDGQTHTFDAVVERTEDALLLLALTPVSTPAYSVRLDADGVAFETHTDRELPFDAAHMLADVQRVFYPWFDEPPSAPLRDTAIDGVLVEETASDGRLSTRTFDRGGERIAVRYTEWADDFPVRVEVDNGWYGYTLEITTHEIRYPDAN